MPWKGCNRTYEQTRKTLALLKIPALGTHQIEAGDVQTAAAAIKQLREIVPGHYNPVFVSILHERTHALPARVNHGDEDRAVA